MSQFPTDALSMATEDFIVVLDDQVSLITYLLTPLRETAATWDLEKLINETAAVESIDNLTKRLSAYGNTVRLWNEYEIDTNDSLDAAYYKFMVIVGTFFYAALNSEKKSIEPAQAYKEILILIDGATSSPVPF